MAARPPIHRASYHAVPGNFVTHSNGNGNGNSRDGNGKRGATAAEALAAELHREIAVREKIERRLIESETRLAEAEKRLASLPSASSRSRSHPPPCACRCLPRPRRPPRTPPPARKWQRRLAHAEGHARAHRGEITRSPRASSRRSKPGSRSSSNGWRT